MIAFFCECQGHSSAFDHSQIIAYCANLIVKGMVGLLGKKKTALVRKLPLPLVVYVHHKLGYLSVFILAFIERQTKNLG